MIIRKPYAFLIKNFKKIHIVLLLLSIFIYFKNTQVYSFVSEFIKLSAYDAFNDPIIKYVSMLSILALLIQILGSITLIFLFRHKKKPWKLYLIPLIEYLLILVSFIFIKSYFNSYTGIESTSNVRAWRDLLLISQFAQIGVFIVYVIRIFGIDLNKFDFKLDEEYLELDQNDREELEININIDKNAFKRTYKRTLRNLNYFYQEHKLLCRVLILIGLIIIGKSSYSYINKNKSFKEGDNFIINGYQIEVNNSYYTDKNFNGKVISKKSAFVIVDLTITNVIPKTRTPDLNKYHVINGISDYTTTTNVYGTEFQDLGKTYETFTLKENESKRLIIVYKVDNKLDPKKFVLFYQAFEDNMSAPKKIKLDIENLTEIKLKKALSLGDTLLINQKDEENIIFEDFEIADSFEYNYRTCTSTCENNKKNIVADKDYDILRIKFGSDTFEGKDMADFMEKYAYILYTNIEGKEQKIEVTNALRRTSYGKYVYLKVPEILSKSDNISLEFIVRNNKYIYKLK